MSLEIKDLLTQHTAPNQVSEQVAAILERSANQPASRAELLAAAELKDVYLNYKRHVLPLIKAGWIELTIPEKPTSRLQRYRLTTTGRAKFNRAGD